MLAIVACTVLVRKLQVKPGENQDQTTLVKSIIICTVSSICYILLASANLAISLFVNIKHNPVSHAGRVIATPNHLRSNVRKHLGFYTTDEQIADKCICFVKVIVYTCNDALVLLAQLI